MLPIIALLGICLAFTIRKEQNNEKYLTMYEPSSIVSKNKIKAKDLQGLWKAHEGFLAMGTSVRPMTLEKPLIIIEVKGDEYRRVATDSFMKFTLKGNMITQEYSGRIDTGYINKLTLTELSISWKQSEVMFMRYKYIKE
jgi:hypothetical protein